MFNMLLSASMESLYIVLIVIGLLAVGVAIWLILCAVIASKMLKQATLPVAHTIDEARAHQLENEHIDLDTYDNVWNKEPFEIDGLHGKLRGEIIRNEADNGEVHRVCVIAHGFTCNRIYSVKYASVFYKLGFSIVLYDHSYFGLSDGSFCTLGNYERHDLSAVIDFTRQTFGKDCIVALHGESMGAATVLMLLGLRSDVDLVVADCGFSDTYKYYCELFTHLTHLPPFPVVRISGSMARRKFGYDFDKCSPIRDVAQSNVPICFIHGKDDDYIYPHHSADMYRASANPLSELHLVDGAQHACSHMMDNDAYFAIVSSFVEKVLGKA